VQRSGVKVLVTVCLLLVEDIYRSHEVCCLYGCFFYHIISYSFRSICVVVFKVVCFVCFRLIFLKLCILIVNYPYCFLCIIVMFMYSYCHVCSVLGILFHCVVPCIVFV
jgi:hypothetical protein